LPLLIGAATVILGVLLIWIAMPRRRRHEEQGASDAT
jgi:hypothetical protein